MREVICHPGRKHRARGLCATCYSTFLSRRWRNNHPQYEKKRYLKRGGALRAQQRDKYTSYGRWLKNIAEHHISLDFYLETLEAQEFKCAICRKDSLEEVLKVDHDHNCCSGDKSCGQCIRGLLCSQCNSAIGLIKDNPIAAQRMVEYLTKEKITIAKFTV